MTRHLAFALCAVYAVLAISTVDAQKRPDDRSDDRSDEARAAFAKGREAARRGDQLQREGQTVEAQDAYEIAAAYFVRAYELAPNPTVLYVLGEVYRMRGDIQFAIACYERFMAQSGSAGDDQGGSGAADDRVARAREHVAALTSGTGTNVITAETLPPMGVCFPDEQATGAHVDESVERAGRPAFASAPEQLPERPPASRQGYRIGFWSASGVAVAAMTMSGVARWRANGPLKDEQLARISVYQDTTGAQLATVDACSDAEQRDAGAGSPERELLDDVIAACHRGESAALVANITLGVAVLSIGAAAYLLYRGYLRPDRSRAGAVAWRPTMAPMVSAETVGAQLHMRF